MFGLILQALFSRVWTALQGLASFARANPALAVIIALCALSGWLWHANGKHIAQRDAARAQVAEMTAAGAEAKRKAIAQRAAVELHYKELAHDADEKHADALADARADLDRYIATHRVRQAAPGRGIGGPASGSQGDGASVPETVPADAVMVSETDVRSCDDAVTYAWGAHDWANSLAAKK